MSSKGFLICLVLFNLAFSALAEDDVCGEDSEPPFTRLVFLTYDGKGAEKASKDDFARMYAGCRDIDKNFDTAFKFLEDFGLDLSAVKEDPFEFISEDKYDWGAYFIDDRTSRALIGSFYEFGEYMNSPVFNAYWRVTVKEALDGLKGPVPKDSYLYFGVLRLLINGRDYCVDYFSDVPNVMTSNEFAEYEVYHLSLYNPGWGTGGSHGVRMVQRNRQSYYWTLRFPADGGY